MLNNVLHTLQHTLHKRNDSYQVRTMSDQRVCVRVCSVKNLALQSVPFGDGLYAQCTAVAVREWCSRRLSWKQQSLRAAKNI